MLPDDRMQPTVSLVQTAPPKRWWFFTNDAARADASAVANQVEGRTMTTIVDVSEDPNLATNGVRTAESQGKHGWDVMMADVVAHLISAYTGIEETFDSYPAGLAETVTFELATRSVCTAVVVLDEVSRPVPTVWEPASAPPADGFAG